MYYVVCTARTQPIIVNATADMMKVHFMPVAKKLREQSLNMRKEEEEFYAEMRRLQHRKESGEVESEIQEVWLFNYCFFHFSELLFVSSQYQSKWLPGKTRLWNDLLCVEQYVKHYSLKSHSLTCC